MLRTRISFMEDQRLLASVALFRKLYDNKKDSYDVLAEFLRASININGLWNFTAEDCSNALKSSFGFQIPSAVLKSCLRHRLRGEVTLSHGKFTITGEFQKSENLQIEISIAQREQENIIRQLMDFVSDLNGNPLTAAEEQQFQDDFYQYFLGGLKQGDSHIKISKFIIKNSNDARFTEKLNHLEEGLILYQGIEYSISTGHFNPWHSKFTVYLDTEILFWANGYDGVLFKSIFDEFIELVREISSKATDAAKFEVKYFPETKKEIDSFFKAAEQIISNGRFSDPSRTAMQHLLNGCKTCSDVVEKKAYFYALLNKLKIYEEVERDYYNPPDYNCENNELLNRLTEDFSDYSQEKIANTLKFFSKINYLRKGVSDKGIEQSTAILVSGKNLSRNLAFHSSIMKNEGTIPFSTSLEYLTERLWFKLGKGFGSNVKTPAAFDVVARAQVILSTQISSKVSSEFKVLLSKIERGEMSTNDASYIVSDLKSRPAKPEELNAENLDAFSDFLEIDSIEASVRSVRILEKKSKEYDDFREKVFSEKIIDWKNGIKKIKNKAKIKYKLFISLSILALIVLLLLIIFLLSGSSDSLLSKIGFF